MDERTDRPTEGQTEAIVVSPWLFFKKTRGDNK